MTVFNACYPVSRRAGLGFLLIATFALLIVTHGGRGYQSITILIYSGFSLLLLTALWLWAKDRFFFSKIQLMIAFSIVAVTFAPAVSGMLQFGTKTGFTFMVINLVVFLFVSQAVRRYGENGSWLLARLFVLTAVIASVLAIVLFFYPVEFMGLGFGREGYFRLTGNFSTPNRFGEVPAVGVLAALNLFLVDPAHRIKWATVCLFFVFVTLLAGSKGVILGLVAGLLIFLLLTKLMAHKTLWRFSAAMLPAVIAVVYSLNDFIVASMKLDAILSGRMDVGSGRPDIWARGAEVFWDGSIFQQLFGHGATAFVTLTRADAHSMYFDLLVNNGVFAWFFLLVILVSAVALLFFKKGDRKMLIFGLSLILFCLARGVAMPTVFNSFNFAMIAFWAGVALLFVPQRRQGVC